MLLLHSSTNPPAITKPKEPRVHSLCPGPSKLDPAPKVAVLPRQNQGWWCCCCCCPCLFRWAEKPLLDGLIHPCSLDCQKLSLGVSLVQVRLYFGMGSTWHPLCSASTNRQQVAPLHTKPQYMLAWETPAQRLCCLLLRGGSWDWGKTIFWSRIENNCIFHLRLVY